MSLRIYQRIKDWAELDGDESDNTRYLCYYAGCVWSISEDGDLLESYSYKWSDRFFAWIKEHSDTWEDITDRVIVDPCL